ncbi:MAG: Uma2 family endonuclease [Actinomycetota bacterium]|nr:Uma2 family endonuclease [Actinomycetota bacterium]
MTAHEYFEVTVEGDHTELVDGAMVVDEPHPLHQLVCGRLHTALSIWANQPPGDGLPILPIDVQLTDHDVYGPDVLWFSEVRVRAHPDVNDLRLQIPDLAVEVRSPSTWQYDVGRKLSVYEASGLSELWLVDTKAETILVYRRSAPDSDRFDVALEITDALTSPQLPGFSLDVPELFRPLR